MYAADGSGDIGHSSVGADDVVVIALLHAVVAQETQLFGEARVIGGDHAALTRCHVLGGVERECAEDAKATDRLSLPCRAVSLGGIFDERNPLAAQKSAIVPAAAGWP